jgi:hypothetical protein
MQHLQWKEWRKKIRQRDKGFEEGPADDEPDSDLMTEPAEVSDGETDGDGQPDTTETATNNGTTTQVEPGSFRPAADELPASSPDQATSDEPDAHPTSQAAGDEPDAYPTSEAAPDEPDSYPTSEAAEDGVDQ